MTGYRDLDHYDRERDMRSEQAIELLNSRPGHRRTADGETLVSVAAQAVPSSGDPFHALRPTKAGRDGRVGAPKSTGEGSR